MRSRGQASGCFRFSQAQCWAARIAWCLLPCLLLACSHREINNFKSSACCCLFHPEVVFLHERTTHSCITSFFFALVYPDTYSCVYVVLCLFALAFRKLCPARGNGRPPNLTRRSASFCGPRVSKACQFFLARQIPIASGRRR